MKKIILLLSLVFLSCHLFALDTDVSYTTFKARDKQYIEVNLFLVGNTMTYKLIDSTQQQAAVEVLMLIKQGENIIQFEKYILNGPISIGQPDFLDLKRFVLPKGDYELEVKVQDVNKPEVVTNFKTDFSLNFSEEGLQQSDIQLLASYKQAEEENIFVKSGVQLEPLAFSFYNKRANRLIFYNEIYNADKAIGQDYLVTYTVSEIVNEQLQKPISVGHKRKKAEPITALLLQTDITELKSGNYELVVEVRNRENELISQKKARFQRSNPYLQIEDEPITEKEIEDEFVQRLSAEQLTYSLRAIAVILNDSDGENINEMIRSQNIDAQRLYLFTYWAQINPVKPYDVYLEYMAVAQAIDEKFDSGFGYGFETDRGYVYMKYGEPSDIFSDSNDPSAPPYEVWSYNEFPMTNQGLVKFMFYNPSLSPGNYVMLHSTARGEVNNPGWLKEMYRSVPNSDGGAGSGFQDGNGGFGRNAGRNFSDF
jgi:GWxTD domain-containing protein